MDNKKKSVCHLTSVHPPFDIRIFHKECVSLAKNGYNVYLIAPINEYRVIDGVKLIPIGLPKSRLLRMLLVTFRMTKKALSVKAKIYHFHDPELMFCGILLRIAGKRIIFDIHENVRLSLESKQWVPKYLVPILKGNYYLMERCSILFYSKLILAEESYLNYYPHKKCVVILNYPLPISTANHIKEFGSPIKFVYSGVVHPLRGIWEMVELIRRINLLGITATLDLIGDVRPTNLNDKLVQYLKDNDLTEKIKIHGKVEFKQVESFLLNADIGLALLKPIPNYRESLPTKIFEYMQHGLPIITNDFPLYKRYVEESETGICVNIDNMEQVIEKVTHLLESSQELQKMHENGPKTFEKGYNWKTQEKKLLELYCNLEDRSWKLANSNQ